MKKFLLILSLFKLSFGMGENEFNNTFDQTFFSYQNGSINTGNPGRILTPNEIVININRSLFKEELIKLITQKKYTELLQRLNTLNINLSKKDCEQLINLLKNNLKIIDPKKFSILYRKILTYFLSISFISIFAYAGFSITSEYAPTLFQYDKYVFTYFVICTLLSMGLNLTNLTYHYDNLDDLSKKQEELIQSDDLRNEILNILKTESENHV
ncbi:hypothetical protein M1446_04100 [Candidatus Dependentiae bacterium]|nr:hypothetical protein [Candidatus Dependentiae bacterium]